MQDIANTFKEKLYECGKHVEKIEDAREYLKELMPLKIDRYSLVPNVLIGNADNNTK